MKQRVFLAVAALCVLRAAFGQTELIVNGGFELVNAGEWQITGAGAFITNGPGAASGFRKNPLAGVVMKKTCSLAFNPSKSLPKRER